MPDLEVLVADRVSDGETLYRSIWLRQECFFFDVEGKLHVSDQAFNDRSQRPSLFRKHLCDNPPYSNPPKLDEGQAVVSFKAGKIRASGPIVHTPEKKPSILHIINIEPDTNGVDLQGHPKHPAHCVVFVIPDFPTANAFKKLKMVLATLVERFDIEPPQSFLETLER